jgi:hypothetical protein
MWSEELGLMSLSNSSPSHILLTSTCLLRILVPGHWTSTTQSLCLEREDEPDSSFSANGGSRRTDLPHHGRPS